MNGYGGQINKSHIGRSFHYVNSKGPPLMAETFLTILAPSISLHVCLSYIYKPPYIVCRTYSAFNIHMVTSFYTGLPLGSGG